MSLYKRKNSDYWWCKFVVDGNRIQQSTGTTDKYRAAEFEARLRVNYYDQTRLGVKPEYTWNDAVIRYRKELDTSGKAFTTIEDEIRGLIWLLPYLKDKKLNEINRDLLDHIIDEKQKTGVKPRTVNAVTKLIRLVLRKAMTDWEWIDRLPKFRILNEPKRRVRFITREEAMRLLNEMPDHLRRMAIFTLETGLRRANVTHLRWNQIDIKRKTAWIHPDEAKSKVAIPVPLTDSAISVLNEAAAAWRCNNGDFTKPRRTLGEYVFTFKDKPVYYTTSTAWNKACARAGITNFHWHDLRHTWASWHVQEGTPLNVLQELGGWESIEMVQKYAHLSTSHLSEFVNGRKGISDHGAFSATPQITED